MRKTILALIWALGVAMATSEPVSSDWHDSGFHDTIEDPDLALWPWNHKASKEDNSCLSHTNCTDCLQASNWCHWCEHDKACHVKGSVYGCFSGVSSCTHDPPSNDTDDSGCFAHKNCTACSLSSHVCHWCAHDNACHVVGSYYGCATGVDCYSNDRCKRNVSDPFDDGKFTEIGPLPLIAIASLAIALCCCTSMCYCVVSGVKGAYDDLHSAARGEVEDEEPLWTSQRPAPVADDNEEEETSFATADNEDLESEAVEEEQDGGEADEGDGGETEEGDGDDNELEPLVESEESGAGDTDGLSTPLLESSVTSSRSRPSRSRHMQRLFNMCTVCYVLNLVVLGAFVVASFRYFPQKPVYNICNDAVAWKQLIDSLASMKPAVDFEILGSIHNPNHLDVALDAGHGSFKHDGTFVGTFTIPPFDAKAKSITDFMIVAHLKPEKWEALSLTAEYYRGKLVLHVESSLSVRIPMLADYAFELDVKDFAVNVNEQDDRSLCACPTWSDEKHKSGLLMPEIDFTASIK